MREGGREGAKESEDGAIRKKCARWKKEEQG